MSDETVTPAVPTPIIRDIPIPPDVRPIAEMPFEGGAATRALLNRCGVQVAHEIETLGCTGARSYGLSIDEITSLRLGLAGGGVGLPCFVAPDRFCLAHNTIGGLQNEQKARYPQMVGEISRELTPQEAGQVAYTEAVRRTGKGGVGEQMATAQGAFSGFGELPRGAEMIEGEPSSRDELHEQMMGGVVTPAAKPFTCPEHTKLTWSCRFCVAQAIVEGELEPTFAVHFPDVEIGAQALKVIVSLTPDETQNEIDAADMDGAEVVEVYALVKTLTRKLA
jgi:hypothetical protein